MSQTRSPSTFGHFSEDSLEYVITDPLAPPRVHVNGKRTEGGLVPYED